MVQTTEAPAAPKVNEGAPAKARRYLCEGRLRVTYVNPNTGQILAKCRGEGETYDLQYLAKPARHWQCTCPARTDQCAHLRALRLVVDRPSS